jgi:hypothetical protein
MPWQVDGMGRAQHVLSRCVAIFADPARRQPRRILTVLSSGQASAARFGPGLARANGYGQSVTEFTSGFFTAREIMFSPFLN